MKNSPLFNAIVTTLLALPGLASATNTMNLETYGPIAGGAGGASLAYDNGNAAMMNNPATLALMPSGQRLDIALGFLGPDITTTIPASANGSGVGADSTANAYYMPAFGWVKNSDGLVYGIGMFAQGGMGTEYGANSDLAGITGKSVHSELSVGRILAPLALRVNEKFSMGATLDFVWGGLDLKMAVPVSDMPGMSPSGSFAALLNNPNATGTGDWGSANDMARFDFADTSPFTGKTYGSGYAAKIGMVYQPNSKLSIGATYHSKTNISDLETGDATMSLYDDTDATRTNGAETVIPMTGKISVQNFQWPAFYGIGAALRPTNRLLLALDVKRIEWSDVMDKFRMHFHNANGDLNVSMSQYWNDQTVTNLGAAYQATDKLTLRLGYNYGKNPLPDQYVHPLFPATVEKHYTAGFGYTMADSSSVNFSIMKAAENTVTNSVTQARIRHSQLNWQLMYTLFY